jgi:hypothetical protein
MKIFDDAKKIQKELMEKDLPGSNDYKKCYEAGMATFMTTYFLVAIPVNIILGFFGILSGLGVMIISIGVWLLAAKYIIRWLTKKYYPYAWALMVKTDE